MRMLRLATLMALGVALLGADRALAAPDAGAGQQVSRSAKKQSTVASRLALRDQQAAAMAGLAIERSQNPEVVQYAQQAKLAHERNLAAIIAWAHEQDLELASVALTMPRLGTGGSGLTTEDQQAFDAQLKRSDPQFRGAAKQAQAELSGLANAPPEKFDAQFLAAIDALQEAQVDAARAARDELPEEADFTELMSATEASMAALGETVDVLQSPPEK